MTTTTGLPMTLFTFTFLIDMGRGGTKIARYSGTNELDARELALSALPDAKKPLVRSVVAVSIEYREPGEGA